MDAENKPDQKKPFDQWLDSALRARVDAEPRMGLEERVLARLASQSRRAGVSLWALLAFAAAALMVVIGIALLRSSKTGPDLLTRESPTRGEVAANARPSVYPMPAPNQKVIASVPVRHGRADATRCCRVWTDKSTVSPSESWPKLAAFPAPRPETEQERLLRRLAAQPDLLQTAHLNSDLPLRELSIPPLNIPPMEGTPPDNSPLY